MSRYSAQIVIRFITYILQFSSSQWVVLKPCNGEWAYYFHHCYCDQHEAPAQDKEISQHSLLGGHELRFSRDDYFGRNVMELTKLTDKMN